MTDAVPVGAPVPSNVADLVEAIEQRARQAGADGATTLLRGMLGSLSEALDAVADRLDDIERAITEKGDAAEPPVVAPPVDVDALIERLAAHTDRVAAEMPDADMIAARLAPAVAARVEEALARIDARVDALEQQVAGLPVPPPAPTAAAVAAEVEGALEGLRDRLGRIELAIAERGPATADLASAVRPLDDRLVAIEARLAAPAPDRSGEITAVVEEVGSTLTDRLAAIEQVVREVDVPDPAVAVRAGVAPVIERLATVEAALRSRGEGSADVAAMRAVIDEGLGRLSSELAGRTASLSTLSDASGEELLARVEEITATVAGGTGTARVIALLEERMSALLRAVADRGDESRAAIDALAGQLDRDERSVEELARAVRDMTRGLAGLPDAVSEAAADRVAARLEPVGSRLDQLDARAMRVEAALAGVRSELEALGSARPDMAGLDRRLGAVAADIREMRLVADERRGDRDLDGAVARVTEAFHREYEVLAERVTALAAGIDATRVMLNQHVEDTDRALGRRGAD
ncbi:MAG TPA: hypothetical protein VHN98_08360 [Acidimicrobiales bacterium]|nr:hypothetical protein [Acidimicrobiales bacterium]